MKIVCDACGAKYSIADEKVAGKVFKIRCKKCSNIIVVRGAKESAADEPQYDEKETRVFDYSGYDNAQDAAAAEAADGAVWHLVIDQEQVGPMTADEVRTRFKGGEVEADSFIWREGFDDWERIDAVADFADLAVANDLAPAAAATSSVDDAAAAMFGGPALEDGAAGQDPADLFTAQSGDSADGGQGGLFGDVGSDDGGLFGTAEPAVAAAAAEPAPVDDRLTGQRNENSVLFSLNNLASLASDSPKSSPSSSSSSSASASASSTASNAPGQEGSGLIDIRAMASMYMDNSSGAAKESGGIDDLPVFSQPSFEAASPVMMPVAQPATSNKLMVALIAGIGALVLIAVVLLILVLRGGDEKKVAAADTNDDNSAEAASGQAGDDNGTPADPTAAGADEGSDKAAGDDPGSDSSDEGSDTKAAPAPAPAPDKPEKSSKPAASRHESASERRARERRERREKERREAAKKKEHDKPAAKPSSGGGCDEITCLVDSSKPCCRKHGSSSHSSGGNSSLPSHPSKSQIRSGMSRVSGAVRRCGKRAGFDGRVKVRIKIAPSGRVSSANASGGPGSVNSCVSSAVRRAHFPKTQRGMSFSYGYKM